MAHATESGAVQFGPDGWPRIATDSLDDASQHMSATKAGVKPTPAATHKPAEGPLHWIFSRNAFEMKSGLEF